MIRFNHKKPIVLFSAAGIIIILIVILLIGRNDSSNLPSTRVQFSDFRIELTATGEVQASRSINVSAPRVRTNLQIINLVSEGTVVDSGDFLLQFDTNELQKIIEDRQSELEIAEANLEKNKASMEANMAQLKSSLENSRASYELAELRLSQMAFEADVKVQEEKLRLRQSEISLEQARTKIESQKKMDAAELTTLELKIHQAKADLNKAEEQLKQMTLTAPAPGLVVYQKIWKGSGMEKIKVGDTPWRGQSLIQLPDLSKMQVETEISEADISKLAVDQAVTIKLDAFPDPTFTGAVGDIASLAHEKEGENDIKVFDVVIEIKEVAEILKPGMTAKTKILIEQIPQQYFLPIEAVFEKDGKQVVFPLEDIRSPIVVIPGKRNENFVIVQGELEEGQLISLVNPFKSVEIERKKTEAASLEMPANAESDRKPAPGGREGRRRR